MVPEILMERPLWIGSIEETEYERWILQQSRPEAVIRTPILQAHEYGCMGHKRIVRARYVAPPLHD